MLQTAPQPSRTAAELPWHPSQPQRQRRRRRAADGLRIAAEQQGEAGNAGGRREVLGRTALLGLAALAASSGVGVQEAAALGFKKVRVVRCGLSL